MANKRMFNLQLIDSDIFLDMPLSAQALYFHLSMRADDDGFINSPNRIIGMLGSSKDDFKLLIAKGFILTFDTGVIVIKHWRLHNAIRKDRYHETIHKKEKSALYFDENKTYTFEDTGEKVESLVDGNQMATTGCPKLGKDRLGKDRLGKDRLDNNILPEQAGQQKQENDNQVSETSYQGAREFTLQSKEGEYVVTEKTIREFERLYPGLDVAQELRKITAWCINNPEKRKTKRGMSRFINGWINKAFVQFVQEPKSREAAKTEKPPVKHNFEQRDYDFKSLEEQLLQKQFEEEK